MNDETVEDDCFLLEGPTERDIEAAAICAARIVDLEDRVRQLAAEEGVPGSTELENEEVSVELDLAMAELGFWRSKHSSLGGRRAQELVGDYILVPRKPSVRAVRLANGYTDLVDVSCSPRDMDATRAEIDLAIRIANEEDGVALARQSEPPAKIGVSAELMARLEDRQRLQHRLSDAEQELAKLSARYLTLRKALRVIASGDGARVVHQEAKLDGIFGNPVPEECRASAAAWSELLERHIEAG
jgi:hypothetical protein